MKTTQKKSWLNKLKAPLIVLVCLVIVLAGYGFGAHASSLWPFHHNDTVVAPSQNKSNAPTQQDNTAAKVAAQASGSDPKTSDQIPVDDSLTAHIDSINEANGVVTFTGSVTGATQAGSCSVTFSTPNDPPLSQTVSASLNGTTATCDPISIPAQSFSYLGDWTVTFRYFVNNTQAVATGTITIQ